MRFYYSKKNQTISPFILGSIGSTYQDTLVFCESTLRESEEDFKIKLYEHVKNEIIESVYIRLFNFKGDFVISLSFPSQVPEKGSNRKGQILTIGALFDGHLFDNGHRYICSFCLNYLEVINYIFEINVFESGIDDLVKFLNNDNKPDIIVQKLQDLRTYTSNTHHLINPRRIDRSTEKKSKKIIDKLFQNKLSNEFILLTKNNLDEREAIEIALAFFDYLLEDISGTDMDFANQKFGSESLLRIIRCLPSDLSLNSKMKIISTISNQGLILIK